ncbi:MAG: hydrogenase 4 subunit E [uncultured bacterium]|uniref:Uncharacterized protein n=1 Tax=Candidatus Magasanikbacteria bacterium RIFOXYD2_FULL_36_9 TaxID=1798707 RepID=A0A1F6NZ57_9BACT|nr:MAG: hydrogenase 4 subunit E [uncultured bacterium]OGH89110.1 MAG: hypothetical protein A2537_00365 [Candidatus Magasanikbacteria bacterium RIFOXYD2_FULL_36_9]
MFEASQQLLFVLGSMVFIASVMLHLAKKNHLAVTLYVVQSLAIGGLLLLSLLFDFSYLLLLAVVCTIIVKGVVAPYFFLKLIKQNKLQFATSTYLNTPLTLVIVALIVVFIRTIFWNALQTFDGVNPDLLLLSLATILVSGFVLINRKGALSQILGVLSIENSIVSFALFAGLEQSPALQFGITFDILVWVIVSSIFVTLIYKQFGTLDVTSMKKLTE